MYKCNIVLRSQWNLIIQSINPVVLLLLSPNIIPYREPTKMLETTDMHIAFCMKIDVYWHVSWTSRYDTSRSFERNPMKRMSRNKLACKLMRFVAERPCGNALSTRLTSWFQNFKQFETLTLCHCSVMLPFSRLSESVKCKASVSGAFKSGDSRQQCVGPSRRDDWQCGSIHRQCPWEYTGTWSWACADSLYCSKCSLTMLFYLLPETLCLPCDD